ncbi:prepilin-type N-terminal cleavage/methylation domain-containing protein [Evansella sp. AB-rgal1]|uniref:type IV pilus modification PilV family protein n=1 Tax=Evansella sp. AB-rgal1 TaxID=3242696 RepID=UPI00359E33E0
MKLVKNQEGFTLIEILLSIAILSIIFISLMNIFPQMIQFNSINETKTQAINTSRQILNDWQNKSEIIDYLSAPSTSELPSELIEQDSHYSAEINIDKYIAIITIAKESDLATSIANAHQIHVQILDNKGTLFGESFGYIVVEE